MASLSIRPDLADREIAYATIDSFLDSLPEGIQFLFLLLIAPNQITNVFAVVGELAIRYPRFDPAILFLGQSDRLPHRSHSRLQYMVVHTIGAI